MTDSHPHPQPPNRRLAARSPASTRSRLPPVPRLASLTRRAAAIGPLQRRRSRRFQAQLAAPKLLHAFADAYPDAVFVEIGANDGDQHDHLRPLIVDRGWRGVMVEPVPFVFERLSRNYASLAGVALERAAIADRDGARPFYHLAEVPNRERVGLPQWYDGIGSFSREAVLDHGRLIPDIGERLVETEVPCLTLDSLCAKHEIDRIDLLLVDVEGYDYELLRHIDFVVHRPALVVYEHYHLAAPDRLACRRLMNTAGYETMSEGFDTWCLRAGAEQHLTDVWRRVTPAVPELAVEDEPR